MKTIEKPTATEEPFINKVYILRGHKVMLDEDLAELYGIETQYLNEQVKCHINRFPKDFMIPLKEKDLKKMKLPWNDSSQQEREKLPYAFTEHGVLMLSSILNSTQAIQVNIQIIRIFMHIRKTLINHSSIDISCDQSENQSENNPSNIELFFQYLDHLMEKPAEKVRRYTLR